MAGLRIIAGERKGHRLKVPRGRRVRPTSERVREALFASLGSVHGFSVLDLFAGTGALGLEALSRGATYCVFVEANRLVVPILKENTALLNYTARSRVLALDYRHALSHLAAVGECYDLLFVDPPYKLLAEVAATLRPLLPRLLAWGGLVVVEGPRGRSVELGLPVVFQRRYGDTAVTIVKGGEKASEDSALPGDV